MTRTEVAIHDIASVLIALKPDTPNRKGTFIQTLEALVRFAISEHELTRAVGISNDLARVAEIQEASRKK